MILLELLLVEVYLDQLRQQCGNYNAGAIFNSYLLPNVVADIQNLHIHTRSRILFFNFFEAWKDGIDQSLSVEHYVNLLEHSKALQSSGFIFYFDKNIQKSRKNLAFDKVEVTKLDDVWSLFNNSFLQLHSAALESFEYNWHQDLLQLISLDKVAQLLEMVY